MRSVAKTVRLGMYTFLILNGGIIFLFLYGLMNTMPKNDPFKWLAVLCFVVFLVIMNWDLAIKGKEDEIISLRHFFAEYAYAFHPGGGKI